MIVKDERGEDLEFLVALGNVPELLPRTNNDLRMQDFIMQQRRIMDSGVHSQLCGDLVEHVWHHRPAC